MAGASGKRPELVSAMLEPGLYPHSPGSVELRETHISWVFLAGDLAYKVKKPLTLPFLDYGTLERRREMCREEVRLNRRFAPKIYLRVVGIAREDGRWALVDEDDASAIEYAVEMRRVEEGRSVAALMEAGELTSDHVRAVAQRLADLHAEAPVAPSDRRDVGVFDAALEENLATLRQAGESILSTTRLDAAERFAHAFLGARREELGARARDGRARDCHGDVRAEHVIVPEHDEIYIYDCVEFDPSLRQIDVGVDLAFLVMDLIALGAEELAIALVDAYRNAGADPGDDPTLWFFAAYRAWVRAKVACVRHRELPDDDPERAAQRATAREHHRLGHRLAWRARLPLALVICGVAGSGKTTLAREVAEISGWAHVSSDPIRKRLAGLAPHERAGPEHYSPEFTARTYRELGSAARDALDRSGGVIVDATFHRREERDAFRADLGPDSLPLLFVQCGASVDVLLERAEAREREPRRISDADAAVIRRQLDEFEPLEEVAPESHAELDTEAAPTELVAELERLVDDRIWSRAFAR